MNSVEEFNNYYLTQISEIGNQVNFEDQKELDFDFSKEKEKEYNIVIDINNSDNKKEKRKKESLTKRFKSYPKNYQTYPLKYKKYIIKMVNKLLINLYFYRQKQIIMMKKKLQNLMELN